MLASNSFWPKIWSLSKRATAMNYPRIARQFPHEEKEEAARWVCEEAEKATVPLAS